MTWLTNWNYRKAITISNTGSALTDYQVLVTIDTATLISSGKMRSDCGDIRFTDDDGYTLLPYWIESGQNTSSTKIWTKIPSIPTSKTIYIYYGIPSETSASNGTNTFLFFDDFNGSSLDTNKWNITGTNYVVSGGELVLTSGTDTFLSGKILVSQPVVKENKSRCSTIINLILFMHLVETLYINDIGGYGVNIANNIRTYTRKYGVITGTHDNSVSDFTVSHIYKTVWTSTEVKFYQDSTNFRTYTTNIPNVNMGDFYGGINGGSGTIYIDWTRIRKYASPEPIFSALGIEEVSGAPSCPTTLKYEGDTIHLSTTPKDGIGPYMVIFKKNNIPISSLSNASENIEVIYDYILTDSDISSATLGKIDFSVYIEDSCPTVHQTCTQLCTITIGCLAPVCNFTVT